MVTTTGTSPALTWRAYQQEALDAITAARVRAKSRTCNAGATRSELGRVGGHGPTMWTACDPCARVATDYTGGRPTTRVQARSMDREGTGSRDRHRGHSNDHLMSPWICHECECHLQ